MTLSITMQADIRFLRLKASDVKVRLDLLEQDPLARLLANRGQKKLKALPARLKTTRQDSEVQQANLDQLGEPMTDTNEEMTQ